MNNIKRILIIALCSILCVCTVPRFSFRSEAASTATYALYQTLLNLSGYLTTRGYSIVHEHGSSIPSITDLQTMTYENMGSLLFDISTKLNAFGASHDSPYLGEDFINAMSEASFRGSILLSKSTRELVDLWLQTSNSDGSVQIGSVTESISNYFTSADFPIVLTTGFGGQNRYLTLTCESIVIGYTTNDDGTAGITFVLPTDINDWSYNALTNKYNLPTSYDAADRYTYGASFTYDGKSYNVPYQIVYDGFPTSVNTSLFITLNPHDTSVDYDIRTIFGLFYGGSYDEVESGELVVSEITDTSDTDLLTSTNTIASDGAIEGDTTIYLPDQATLENAIDQYNQGGITYEDFLKIFGVNSVASDATVQEKEDALNVVVTPSEDYLWFTKTQWGADSLEETRKASASTRAEEDSLADSIANTANGGSDPDDPENKSRGKGLLALLLLGLGIWNTPIIAGDGTPSSGGTDNDSDDSSGDNSGYLAESIAGMAVAGSLVDDLFDSAGGSNGYGLIYTVGASFVIFSVIIGAANYFGALFHGSDTKQNIKASGKRSTPGKEKKGG